MTEQDRAYADLGDQALERAIQYEARANDPATHFLDRATYRKRSEEAFALAARVSAKLAH